MNKEFALMLMFGPILRVVSSESSPLIGEAEKAVENTVSALTEKTSKTPFHSLLRYFSKLVGKSTIH